MLNKLRKHIALFLLVLLTGVSIPKDWIHHCADDNREISGYAHSTDHNDEDCAVCDFEFGTAQLSTFDHNQVATSFNYTLFAGNIPELIWVVAVMHNNKAPPAGIPFNA